jgi:hypothetical protein
MRLSSEYKALELHLKLDPNTKYQTAIDSLDSIRDNVIFNRGSKSSQYDGCKAIYCGKYRITANKQKGQLLIESEKTKIILLSATFATGERIDEMFEGIK